MAESRLHQLAARGQSVWIDLLSRELVHGGELARMIEHDARRLFFGLAITDVQDAADVLRPVWERTGGRDGYVSLEVDPGLADDTEATLEQAVELHDAVGRPNVYIKIPATVPGLSAIEDSIARGVS